MNVRIEFENTYTIHRDCGNVLKYVKSIDVPTFFEYFLADSSDSEVVPESSFNWLSGRWG